MEQRWLFLEQEPREKIIGFSREMYKNFRQNWLFFQDGNLWRDYTLERFLEMKTEFSQTRLVTGDPFSDGPKIRFKLSSGNPMAEAMINHDEKNYRLVDRLFLRNFGKSIEEYSP